MILFSSHLHYSVAAAFVWFIFYAPVNITYKSNFVLSLIIWDNSVTQ